jgi:hypothetical protein
VQVLNSDANEKVIASGACSGARVRSQHSHFSDTELLNVVTCRTSRLFGLWAGMHRCVGHHLVEAEAGMRITGKSVPHARPRRKGESWTAR